MALFNPTGRSLLDPALFAFYPPGMAQLRAGVTPRALRRLVGAASLSCLLAIALAAGSCAEEQRQGPPGTVVTQVRLDGVKNGDTITGAVTVTALVTGSSSLRGVEFWVGNKKTDTVLSNPYKTTINSKEFADGETTIAAVASVDTTHTYRAQVNVKFDNTGPVVELLEPKGESLYLGEGDLALKFNITDPSGVLDVKVKANGIPLPASGPPYEATFNLQTLSLTPADLPVAISFRVEATDKVFLTTTNNYDLKLLSRLAWKYATLGEIWAPPALDSEGTAYFGSRDGFLYAVDMKGALKWKADCGQQIVLTPLVETLTPGEEHIWVSAGDEVHVFTTAGTAGKVFPAGHTVSTSPVQGNGVVYVGTYDGQLVALDPKTVTAKWSYSAPKPIQGTPTVLEGDVVVFGCDDWKVYAVDDAGKEKWTYPTGKEIWSTAITAQNGDVLIGSNDGYLYRLNRYGTEQWKFEARGGVWGAAAEAPGGSIYVSSTYRRLYGLSAKGESKWEFEVSGLAYSTPALGSSGSIYIGATDGTVYSVKPDGTQEWSYGTGAEIKGAARVSADETLVLIGTSDRNLYALSTGAVSCPAPLTVDVGGTLVMKYEASRADATAQAEGVAASKVCSRAGVKPWTKVSFTEAQAACKAIGFDLCEPEVWELACQGAKAADFPYGETYDSASCNGKENAVGGCSTGTCAAMPTGANTTCVSAAGVFDASGNVREWTLGLNGTDRVVRGGGFRNTGDDMRCSNTSAGTHALAPDSKVDDVGFRCCKAQSIVDAGDGG